MMAKIIINVQLLVIDSAFKCLKPFVHFEAHTPFDRLKANGS